jgi:hypothetical protein
MREFWSVRPNKWQHSAQTLRFEWLIKQEILSPWGIGVRQADAVARSITSSKAPKTRSGDKSCIQDLAGLSGAEGIFMSDTIVKLRLNQQQLELMDRTIAQGVAPDRIALVHLALREYAAAHKTDAAKGFDKGAAR